MAGTFEVSLAMPLEVGLTLPPLLGGGESHLRLRWRRPAPHVEEQALQGPQLPHTPSTGQKACKHARISVFSPTQ